MYHGTQTDLEQNFLMTSLKEEWTPSTISDLKGGRKIITETQTGQA